MEIKTEDAKKNLEAITNSVVETEERSGRFIAHWPDWHEPVTSKLAFAAAMEHETRRVEEVRVTPTTFTIVIKLPEKEKKEEESVLILPPDPKVA